MSARWLGIALSGLLISASASADVVIEGTPFGFAETDGAYSGTKTVTVFSDPDGSFRYVYEITSSSESFVGINEFIVDLVDDGSCPATEIGVIEGAPGTIQPDGTGQLKDGNDPASGVVWFFTAPRAVGSCAQGLCPGETTWQMFIRSDCGPGSGLDLIVSYAAEAGSDTQSPCFGPAVAGDDTGSGISCTIGWWKNRADSPHGQAQHFPDPQFQQVVDAAAALTTYYADGDALLAPLLEKKPSKQQKADRQLSALLLSLAAGDRFADNQKCKLFAGNAIVENSCTATTIGGAVDEILSKISDPATREDAKDCADDINNAMGVSDTVHSD